STLLTHPNMKGYLPSYTNSLDFFIKFCQRMANENSKQALTQTIALLEVLPFVYTNADEEQAFHQLVRSLKKQAARDNETLCFVSSIKHIAIQATLLKIRFHLDKTQKTNASL